MTHSLTYNIVDIELKTLSPKHLHKKWNFQIIIVLCFLHLVSFQILHPGLCDALCDVYFVQSDIIHTLKAKAKVKLEKNIQNFNIFTKQYKYWNWNLYQENPILFPFQPKIKYKNTKFLQTTKSK